MNEELSAYPFLCSKGCFMLFIKFFSRIFFSFFLKLYHWSLFGLNNAWHVVFDMNEVRIFRLLLIKNWSILQQLNYQVIVFFPLMMLWRLVSTSPTTKRFVFFSLFETSSSSLSWLWNSIDFSSQWKICQYNRPTYLQNWFFNQRSSLEILTHTLY